MHESETVLENERHKILWNFKIQTDHLTPARRPGLVVINKKEKKKKKRTCYLVNFAVLVDHKVIIKENIKTDKY